ncbi:hypothetical protein [Alienimonas chondri]|uniref:Uncharacterized protein n=1 Tax=Alienimonas chondri TaxID=2681879 RepID=A0ABX1VGR1_9PLAN|nr:hypothetical protein [Alienimonas chondri]NNJ27284.1 hypothetical protein [Alienimonas chondri]
MSVPSDNRPPNNRLGLPEDAPSGDGLPNHGPGNGGTGDGLPGLVPAAKTTLRLGPLVVSGEIDNTRPYAVCGWLKLRGQEHPLTLNLTGDAGEGLRGKRIRFEAAPGGVQIFTPPKLSESLAWQQVGPTGPMTLDRSEAPGQNGSLGPAAGLTPPASGPTPPRTSSQIARPNRERLRLEWDSQNGRVRLDLVGAAITELPSHDEDDDLDDPDLALTGDDADRDGEDDALLDLLGGSDQDDDEDDEFSDGGDLLFDDEDDDPFGLFDPDLQDALDDDADALDREAMPDLFGSGFGGFGDEDGDRPGGQFGEDLRRLEALIEGGAGVPIGQVFDPPLRLRRPDQLDDARVEAALKLLLSRLAEHGIALDVCEHFTPRQSYAYLLDEICPAELTHPELDPVRWVQHFSTSDSCPECEAEFEREFEEYERDRRRRGEDNED